MATVQMSLKDVQSTARAVLDNHSKQFQALNGTSQGSPVKSPPGRVLYSFILLRVYTQRNI